ncbi:neurogenic protein mastermind-like [Hyposmocoma kahamanoa]|uniref:neurogenic protein mastermind-like n=1 Tax=Hyposmocoma kahamanoa TaxID=1477025 RepID=UPI000E6D865D|nr:neurogenic protein mastermind-like [Hyposmocoma kahamanoa]
MALDKQRILSELGSVMNQLQSADCGCMGKIFNSGQENAHMGSSLPTCSGCRHGCCRGHGYGVHYNNGDSLMSGGGMCRNGMDMGAGGVGGGGSMGMGASGMGMGGGGGMGAGGMGMGTGGRMNTGFNQDNNYMGMNAGGMPMRGGEMGAMASTMDHNAASGEPMKHLGNEILNMMMNGRNANTNSWRTAAGGIQGNLGKGESMLIDAPQSPHGQIGLTPYSPAMGANDNINNPAANMGMGNSQMANPTTHYVTQDNMYSQPPEANIYNTQGNEMNGNMVQNMKQGIQNSAPSTAAQNAGLMNSRPGVPLNGSNNYGQHTLGMKAFQNMFPGVAEGNDLGFDPMAIAIQMNPANQKRAAMDNINKIMNNQPQIRSNIMQPAIQGLNTISARLPQQQQQDSEQLNAPIGQQNLTENRQPTQNGVPDPQGFTATGQIGEIDQDQQQVVSPGAIVPQNKQIYTSLTTPTINQPIQQLQTPQQLQGQVHSQQLQGQTEYQQGQTISRADTMQQRQALFQEGQTPQQQMIDPATGARLNYRASGDPNAQIQNQGMIKETLYPADTSRNTVAYAQPNYAHNYNTLGQPISLERADKYHTPIPPLPQTLSPQDRFESSVKNSVSKTSLAANRVMGQAPSKSQLRHIYRQYKAGHVGMQQSIRPPQGSSQSDGQLYPPGGINAQINYNRGQAPIERVGGDTIENVNTIQEPKSAKPEQNIGQIRDTTQINKPQGDSIAEKGPMMQTFGKNRNGLQDMRFTKYINNNGWSFHGDFAPAYAYRSRRPV